jgi:hypothetical protein
VRTFLRTIGPDHHWTRMARRSYRPYLRQAVEEVAARLAPVPEVPPDLDPLLLHQPTLEPITDARVTATPERIGHELFVDLEEQPEEPAGDLDGVGSRPG